MQSPTRITLFKAHVKKSTLISHLGGLGFLLLEAAVQLHGSNVRPAWLACLMQLVVFPA